jgi:hypothetical protein
VHEVDHLGLRWVSITSKELGNVSRYYVGGLVMTSIYPSSSTLANLTLIILFSELLKSFLKNISSFQIKKYILKDISEYLGIFHLLKCIFQN